MKEDTEPDAQQFVLEEQTELRFEVHPNRKVTLELIDGKAEIFGVELLKKKKFIFSSAEKVAVFTWNGCTLELIGKLEVAYVAGETPMVFYANIHGFLEQMRAKAEKGDLKGPMLLITGPPDVGKTTLCHILLNYAVRLNRRPVFVDLDVELNSITIPGTIAAHTIARVAEVGAGFAVTAPYIFHYGHKSPTTNIMLYNQVVSELASAITCQAEEADKKFGSSGYIINTGGWVTGEDYQAIKHTAKAFGVHVVLVIDQERLYNDLVRDIDGDVNIVLVPKSGGVVVRSPSFRAIEADNRVRRYFYGLKTHFYPHSFDVKFSDIRVFKIGVPSLPESLVPLGMKLEDKRTKLVQIQNAQNISHRVLSITHETELEEVPSSNIVGFICVTKVDQERRIMTVLSPQPRPLPKTIYLMGDVQFMDSS